MGETVNNWLLGKVQPAFGVPYRNAGPPAYPPGPRPGDRGGEGVLQLDEYRGLPPDEERSFATYLRGQLREISVVASHGLYGAAAVACRPSPTSLLSST